MANTRGVLLPILPAWSAACGDGGASPRLRTGLNQKSQNDCTDPVNTRADVAHNAMVTDASVTAQVIARVLLHDAGNP